MIQAKAFGTHRRMLAELRETLTVRGYNGARASRAPAAEPVALARVVGTPRGHRAVKQGDRKVIPLNDPAAVVPTLTIQNVNLDWYLTVSVPANPSP